MVPKVPLPHSQEHAPESYPEQDEFSPHSQILFPKIHFIIILPYTTKYPMWFLPLMFYN